MTFITFVVIQSLLFVIGILLLVTSFYIDGKDLENKGLKKKVAAICGGIGFIIISFYYFLGVSEVFVPQDQRRILDFYSTDSVVELVPIPPAPLHSASEIETDNPEF